MNKDIETYNKESLLEAITSIKQIIAENKMALLQSANAIIIKTYWEIGKRIVEIEQDGKVRAAYGSNLLKNIAIELTEEYGSGYSERNLAYARKAYVLYPDYNILQTRLQNLSWSHLCLLTGVEEDAAREWYFQAAQDESWGVRTLQRNIASQYYFRMLQAPQPSVVKAEMQSITQSYPSRKDEYIKSPVVAEFLGLSRPNDFTENNLETAILNHIQTFIMELGKGYSFVARQQRITTDMGDYYIDLVFYNYYLKCFLLIDLKTAQISHADVGQMDMYVRMYDELKRPEGDNPTIGLILCSETSKDMARFSVMHNNPQLYAAKYLTYLPSEEELRREIERQKEIYQMQHDNTK